MTPVTEKCAMFGCTQPSYKALAIGPATVVNLCFEHFLQEGGVVEGAGDSKEMLPARSATPATNRE